MSALVKYLLRDPENRSVLDLKHDTLRLLKYASFYTPTKTLDEVKTQQTSNDEKWYYDLIAFLDVMAQSFSAFEEHQLNQMAVQSLPWLDKWQPWVFRPSMKYLVRVLEFGSNQAMEELDDPKMKQMLYQYLSAAKALHSLPDPTIQTNVTSYLQTLAWIISFQHSPPNIDIILRMISNDILRTILLNDQTSPFASTFRRFWDVMQFEDHSFQSSISKNSPDDIRRLVAFRQLWDNVKTKTLTHDVDTMLPDGTRMNLIPKGTTLTVLYETIFTDRATWIKELFDKETNSERIQKAFVLFIGLIDLCRTDTDISIAFDTLAHIPTFIL